jgi:ribonucleotide monophosphatase NagD (HAD superfamily)
MGKPAAVIYQGALEMLGLPANEVVAVGDSLEHDIGGAQAAGVDSLFVLGGIHCADVGLAADGGNGGGDTAVSGYSFSKQQLDAAYVAHGVSAPEYVVPYFALR